MRVAIDQGLVWGLLEAPTWCWRTVAAQVVHSFGAVDSPFMFGKASAGRAEHTWNLGRPGYHHPKRCQ